MSFALVVILTITFLTRIVLTDEFIQYIDSQNQNQMTQIVETLSQSEDLNELFYQTDYTKTLAQKGILLVVQQGDFVFDGFTVYESIITELRHQHQVEEEKLKQYVNEIYSVYETTLHTPTPMVVQIHHYRPMYVNDIGWHHLQSLNQTFIWVSGVTIVVAAIVSLIMSQLLTKPVKQLIRRIDDMKSGKLDVNQSDMVIKEYYQLNMDLRELNQRLWNQRNMRKRKSTDLSHELRTPLTAVLLTLENIEEGIWSYDQHTQKSLKEEMGRLQLLIDDIQQLEETDLQTLALNIGEVDLESLVSHVLLVLKPLIVEKGIHVETVINKKITQADLQRLQQVIMNIVHNAIKYGRVDGKILLSVTGDMNETIISIKDDGIGMDKHKQSLVLERYYRTHQTNQQGSGLGLAICKELIEAHGGQLLIFSELNKGTEVIIILMA